MKQQGFVLPFSIILAFVVLTSLGLWYRQVVLQSFLAERLLVQRASYIECRSLLPGLKGQLDNLSPLELAGPDEDFMKIEVAGSKKWRITRSPIQQGRIRLGFRKIGQNSEPLMFIVPYEGNSVSGLPPDFPAE